MVPPRSAEGEVAGGHELCAGDVGREGLRPRGDCLVSCDIESQRGTIDNDEVFPVWGRLWPAHGWEGSHPSAVEGDDIQSWPVCRLALEQVGLLAGEGVEVTSSLTADIREGRGEDGSTAEAVLIHTATAVGDQEQLLPALHEYPPTRTTSFRAGQSDGVAVPLGCLVTGGIADHEEGDGHVDGGGLEVEGGTALVEDDRLEHGAVAMEMRERAVGENGVAAALGQVEVGGATWHTV